MFVIRFSFFTALLAGVGLAADHPGKAVYQKLCAECHGDRGQGVEGEYDDALAGEKSLDALARYIDRTMPEDDPEKTTAEDSKGERPADSVSVPIHRPSES